jgi:hypothetical protein
VLEQMRLAGPVMGLHHESPTQYKIFLPGGVLDINLEIGELLQEKVSRRPFFFFAGYLHLNIFKSIGPTLSAFMLYVCFFSFFRDLNHTGRGGTWRPRQMVAAHGRAGAGFTALLPG